MAVFYTPICHLWACKRWHIDNRLTVNLLQTKDKKAYNAMQP